MNIVDMSGFFEHVLWHVTSCPLVIGGDTRCDNLCPRTCRDKVGESGVTHSEPTAAKRTGGEGEGEEKRGKRRK